MPAPPRARSCRRPPSRRAPAPPPAAPWCGEPSAHSSGPTSVSAGIGPRSSYQPEPLLEFDHRQARRGGIPALVLLRDGCARPRLVAVLHRQDAVADGHGFAHREVLKAARALAADAAVTRRPPPAHPDPPPLAVPGTPP